MKKFLKENWFELEIIIILLTILLSIAYYFVIFLPTKEVLRTENHIQAQQAEQSNNTQTIQNNQASLDQNNNKNYKHFSDSVDVYDEHDNLVGTLIEAYTDECGSDCDVDVLFLKSGSTDKLIATPIPELGAQSLGLDFVEKDKNIYRSTFIWGASEGHFGCHYFKIEKINYIDNHFELKEDFVANKKYAFDIGDAQGKCSLFPGLKTILEEHDNIQSQVSPPVTSCDVGYYKNVDGNCVQSPSNNPSGASAQCKDGTYSYSQHRQGTCSGHGGVADWF